MTNIFNAVDSADKDSIAIEALIMAETQFMTDDYPKEEIEDISEMVYKDDDGYYRITGMVDKWDSFEDLQKSFPDL